MNNDLPFKVMVWGLEKSSHHFPTLKSAAQFFVDLSRSEKYNCFPDDYPGSPHGELWYSYVAGKKTSIILCKEYDEGSIDWEKNTTNPPLEMQSTYSTEREELRRQFPNFRFEIWDELPGDKENRVNVIKSAKFLVDALEDETISAVESYEQMLDFIEEAQAIIKSHYS